MTNEVDAARLRELADRRRKEERTEFLEAQVEVRAAWARLRDEIGLRERSAVLDQVLERCKAKAERGYTTADYDFKIDKDLVHESHPTPELEAVARKFAGWSLLAREPGGRWRLGVHGEWLTEQLRARGFRVEFFDAAPEGAHQKWKPPGLMIHW